MIDTNSKLPYIAGLLLALIISIGLGYFFSSQGEDYSAVNVQNRPPKVETQSSLQAVTETTSQSVTTPAEVQSIPQQTGALNALDLSLGNFSIDDPESKVRQALGTPLKTSTDPNGATRLTYDAIEIVLRNGKISALVSQTSAVSTPRGIHDGSPAQEVFDAYGTNYQSEPFENTTLYEYTITSKDGTPCWLRFAVRDADRRVDYISIRFVQ
ncbi:MAG: hypothetical protein IJ685_13890 [Selenomonadaceae bacterium]|nr:hypothetical protein [Selenomonadaceae bacterium]